MKNIVLKPRVSEKAYGTSLTTNTFVFIVPSEMNRVSVAHAVAAQYGVEVTDVNILNQKGKVTRTYRNKRFTEGKRSDFKKAYVTLKKGQSLPIFAAVEEAEAKTEKADKKSDDKKAKSTKKAGKE